MKIKFHQIFVLFFLASNLTIAQYTPFVEEGKFWIYRNHQDPDFSSPTSGHAYTFLGDTIINNLVYKKVYYLNLKGEHNCPDYYMPCWDFIYPYQTEYKQISSFIREDTINRIVYHLPPSGGNICGFTEEYILFDFSLSLGDTLNDCVYESIWASQTYTPGGIVDSMKVVEAFGKPRNTIFTFGFFHILGLPFETEIRISEGIGFNDFGIFYYSQSAFSDYCEGEVESCNIILPNKNIQSKTEIKVFPNPSNGIFQLSIESQNIKRVRVYSILGQLVKEFKFTNILNLSNLEEGIYYLELVVKNDEQTTIKIVKENN